MPQDYPEVQFRNWRCRVEEGRYANGRIALQLRDAEDGSSIATASVNLPDEPLGDGEVFVKSYSENEGMLQALESAGIVQRTGEWVTSGHVQVPKCRLVGRQR